MREWWEQPEASGPMSEREAGGLDVQALADRSIRLPQLDQAELAEGRYVPVRGFDPYQPSAEQRDRERAEADRRWQIREAAERAAIQAGQSALEAASTTDRMLREAAETAAKVALR